MKPILTCTVITNKATFQNKSQTARAYSRKNRIYTFRRFLLDTFPRLSRTVNCNDGRDDPPPIVLDVAGGKGSLSFLLQHVDGYESVVVDPVPNNYRSIVRSIEFLARNPAVRRERAVEGWEGHQPLAALLPRLMKRAQIDTTETAAAWTEEENLSFFPPASHLKLYFDNALVEAVREYVTQSKIDEQTAFHDWSVFFHSASARISFNGTRNNHNIISDPHRALHTIMEADLLVGFHPDQATEPIVDLAIYLGKPFAIVPCCVFPREFPNRLLLRDTFDSMGGSALEEKKVRKYEDLVCYLKLKHKKMRACDLEFNEIGEKTARRTVLYMTPEDF